MQNRPFVDVAEDTLVRCTFGGRKMFQKNDLIVYGNTGICRVEEIGTPESLPGVDKGKLYY